MLRGKSGERGRGRAVDAHGRRCSLDVPANLFHSGPMSPPTHPRCHGSWGSRHSAGHRVRLRCAARGPAGDLESARDPERDGHVEPAAFRRRLAKRFLSKTLPPFSSTVPFLLTALILKRSCHSEAFLGRSALVRKGCEEGPESRWGHAGAGVIVPEAERPCHPVLPVVT